MAYSTLPKLRAIAAIACVALLARPVIGADRADKGELIKRARAAYYTSGPPASTHCRRPPAPNGDGPRNHPLLKLLNLPALGQAVRAAPLVTKTLLFVSEGDQTNVRTPPNGGGKQFRAFDKATGAMLWETELDAGTTGTPISYTYKARQYIVVAIGRQNHPTEFVALALPGDAIQQN